MFTFKTTGRHRAWRRLFALSLLTLAVGGAGCGKMDPGATPDGGGGRGGGGGGTGGADGGPLPTGSLLPWKTGNTWSYQVNDQGVMSMKTTTVEGLETVGGMGPNKDQMAFKVVTKKGTLDQTVSWQLDDDGTVIRYREQSFSASSGALELEEHWDPHKIHVDGSAGHTAANASWLEIYQETKLPVGGVPSTSEVHDLWTVLSASESVTVPAGTFDAIKLQKVGGSVKTYWYVRGVGKVKETGGQVEELVSYSVMP